MLSQIARMIRPLGNIAWTVRAEAADGTFASLVAFSLEDRGQSSTLAGALLGSGIEHEIFRNSQGLAAGLGRRPPDIVFLDLRPGTTESIDALFALSKGNYSGGVQLMCDRDLGLIDGFKRVGERLGLQMLPALARPFDEAAVAGILEAEGLRAPNQDTAQGTLEEVLRNGQIEFWYQPKIHLRSRNLAGVEVLARVRDPKRGVMSPGPYLKNADEKSLIELNRCALVSALETSVALWDMGARLQVAVNVSAKALRTLPVQEIVQKHRPKAVKWPGLLFDVTEQEVAADPSLVDDVFFGLAEAGVQLAIDDYGRGGLSMGQLRQLSFVELKLNRLFVTDCHRDETKAAICESVIDLVHGLGAVAVAIGVEKEVDMLALQRMGCDIGQGFLFGEPMPQDRFLALLQERAKRQSFPRAGRAG